MQPEPGNIAMMQIDCEVMATRLVEVSKANVPHYAAENVTTDTVEPPFVQSNHRPRDRENPHIHPSKSRSSRLKRNVPPH